METFQDYWAEQPGIDYDEMVCASNAWDHQAKKIPCWIPVTDLIKIDIGVENPVMAIRSPTSDMLAREKEYFPIITAAITDEGDWYDWNDDELINGDVWEITHFMALPLPPSE
jgi:hypothetical protein